MDYKRYVFRCIKQEQNEPFESFLMRLLVQASECNFLDLSSQMKDQIIEKCSIDELRQKAFRQEMTLKELTATAQALSKVKKKVTDEVIVIDQNCSRCGSNKHEQSDINCPAIKSLCECCKQLGHFSSVCRSSVSTKKRLNSVSDDEFRVKQIKVETSVTSPCQNLLTITDEKRSENKGGTNQEKNQMLIESVSESKLKIKSVESLASFPTPFKVKLEPSGVEVFKEPKTVYEHTKLSRTCLVGGMCSRFTVDPSSPANIMSRFHFRALRIQNLESIKRFVMATPPVRVGKNEFYGRFAVKVEHKGVSQEIDIYLREGNEDSIVINRATAELLGLPFKVNISKKPKN